LRLADRKTYTISLLQTNNARAWLHDACGPCECWMTGWDSLCFAQHNTGYSVNGSFVDYVIGAAPFVGRLPEKSDLAEMAPILCTGVTTYKGIKETDAKPGEWLAISGIGGLGQLAVQYANLSRDRLRSAIYADAHIGKDPLGDLDPVSTDAALRPALYFHGDRGMADLLDGNIATDLVADQHRAMKRHGGNGDRSDAAAGAAGRDGRASKVHLTQEPAAEDVAVRIGVSRHRDGADRRFAWRRRFGRRSGR
jgi:hypothetical protein